MNHSLIRRACALSLPANVALISLVASCSLSWLASRADAAERYWTGASSANWSDPANWSPAGVPQDNDSLWFGYISDSRRSSVNDLVNLHVYLDFTDNDYQVDGNALTLFSMNVAGPSHTVIINCPILTQNGTSINVVGFEGLVTENTTDVYLNGPIEVSGTLDSLGLYAFAFDSGAGFNSHIYVSSQISGAGHVFAWAKFSGGHSSTIEFNGTPGNTFSGALFLESNGGYAPIVFNKSSGAVATNYIIVSPGETAYLNLAAPNQIGDNTTIEIGDGSQLFLSGNNVAAGTLILTNSLADTVPSTLDTGTTLLGLTGGIVANVNSATVNPVIKGRLNLVGYLPFDVRGGSEPSLEIQAAIGGNGFHKIGDGTLRLSGNNTFIGDAEISQGTVEAFTATAFGQPGTNFGVHLEGGNIVLENVDIGTEPLFVRAQSQGKSFLLAVDQCSWAGPVVLETNLNVAPSGPAFLTNRLDISGSISGTGGLNLFATGSGTGTVRLSGASANTYTGTTVVICPLVEFNKPPGTKAFAGPLEVGGYGTGGPYEARWLSSYQNVGANLTLYANAIVNLNNNNEDFGPVTFNGGEVDTGVGQFAIYAPLTVNASPFSAVINGYLGLPPGAERVFIVNDGPADCDLLINAVIFGSPAYFVKQGAGTICLANANTYDAVTLLEQGILDIGGGSSLGTWPGMVISDGATLRVSGAGTGGGFEAVGAGVGGTHGAIEVLPNASFSFSGGMLLDGSTIFNVGQSAGLALNGAISSSGPGCSLIKNGTGVLTLSGSSANTYSGDSFINAGGCNLSKSGGLVAVPGKLNIGPAPTGPTVYTRLLQSGGIGGAVTVNANSLLDLNGFNLTLSQLTLNDGGSVQTGGGTLSLADGSSVNVGSQNGLGSHLAATISGFVSLPVGSATFNVSPAASTPPLLLGPELDIPATLSGGSPISLTVMNKYGLGQMQLRGNSTYFNQTRIYEGAVIAASANALGSSSGGTYVYNNAALALDGGIAIPAEYVLLDSTNKAALDSRGGANAWGGTVYLNRNSSINVNNALALNGVVDGPGNLLEVGPGSLTLGGSSGNTLTGEVLVNQGTLLLNKPAAVTAIPGALEIGSDNGGFSAIARNVTSYQIVGNIYVHSTGLYDINGQQENTDALIMYGNGTVQTGAGYLSLKTGAPVFVFPGTNTTATINGNVVLDPGSHVLNVPSGSTDTNVYDLVINAGISETSTAAGLQKEGAGRARLTGFNPYTGPTTLNSGTLQVDGTQLQSPVQINAGTLQGGGAVGTINFGGAGVVAPGASPGILTCSNFTGSANGTLQIELNGALAGSGYDQLNVLGTVGLSNLKLNVSANFAAPTNTQFVILRNDRTDPVSGTFAGLPQGATLTVGSQQFQISYTGGTGNDVVLSKTADLFRPALSIESVTPGFVRLVWPTNDPTYVLQSEYDLAAMNWVVVPSPPAIVGANYVVTNVVSGASQFYRLAK